MTVQSPHAHYRADDELIAEAQSDYAHPLFAKKVALARAHAAMAALPVELYLEAKYPPLREPVSTTAQPTGDRL